MDSKIDMDSATGFDQMRVTVYLKPLIYVNSKVVGDYYHHHEFPKYEGAVPFANGDLHGDGELLENPIREEFEKYRQDCVFYLNEIGYQLIDTKENNASDMLEYVINFKKNDRAKQTGTFVLAFRIVENPFDQLFSQELRERVLGFLDFKKFMTDMLTYEQGIDFRVENVHVEVAYHSLHDAMGNVIHLLSKERENDNVLYR